MIPLWVFSSKALGVMFTATGASTEACTVTETVAASDASRPSLTLKVKLSWPDAFAEGV